MRARLSDQQKREARELYLSNTGLSVDTVAESYGVGRTVMLNVLKGITRSPGARPKSSMTTAQMIALQRQGFTLTYIATQSGLTESGVWRRIDKERKVSA